MFALDVSTGKRDAYGANRLAYDFTSSNPEGPLKGRVFFLKNPDYDGKIKDELISQHIANAVTIAQEKEAKAEPCGLLQARANFQADMAQLLSTIPGLTFESFEKLH